MRLHYYVHYTPPYYYKIFNFTIFVFRSFIVTTSDFSIIKILNILAQSFWEFFFVKDLKLFNLRDVINPHKIKLMKQWNKVLKVVTIINYYATFLNGFSRTY